MQVVKVLRDMQGEYHQRVADEVVMFLGGPGGDAIVTLEARGAKVKSILHGCAGLAAGSSGIGWTIATLGTSVKSVPKIGQRLVS